MTSTLFAYLLAALIGYVGYRSRALTWDGAVAACLVGGTVFGFGGLGCAVLLVLFFASSSVLSFFKTGDARKQKAAETFDKGGKRDAGQVLANGGVAALAALLLGTTGNSVLFFGAFLGALAAATADTWATEIGVLSARLPRMLTTGKQVPAGTSGGVTLLGSGAALVGAGLIGVVAWLLAIFPLFSIPPFIARALAYIAAGVLAGGAGMLADSLLGGSVQASYWCPLCDKPTESRVHSGTPTELRRGIAWINNDLVNLAGTIVGASVGAVIASVL